MPLLTRLLGLVRSQRAQSLTEFALISPVLLLILFGIVDFGRVIYTYVTINQAVNEGARVAIRESGPLPSNTDVETAVKTHAVNVILANPCPNGPITSAAPPDDSGWIFITEPNPPATVEALSPTLDNAPGGEIAAAAAGACSATDPAHWHAPLQVSVIYNFVPYTPLVRALTGPILIRAAAVYRTEY